eukprot:440187-Heterocapsa_arctica.AAC.1
MGPTRPFILPLLSQGAKVGRRPGRGRGSEDENSKIIESKVGPGADLEEACEPSEVYEQQIQGHVNLESINYAGSK